MITDTHIADTAPFAAQSTFLCDGLSIPRGLFYGGCFYTAQAFVPPIHISYIAPGGVWGVADATGVELAQVHFTASSPVGNIVGTDGQYAGCLKARIYDYCKTPASGGISTSGGVISGGDLEVFLRGITRRYELDAATLILDICCCTALASYEVASPEIREIHLPDDCALVLDDNDNYYMSAIPEPSANTPALQRLVISGGSTSCTLSGSHVSILPWCETPVAVGTASGGYVPLTSGAPMGAQDITVSVVDGAIVIATLGSFSRIND